MFFVDNDNDLQKSEGLDQNQPSSPAPSTPTLTSASTPSNSSKESSSGGETRRMRSLRDLYNDTEPIEMMEDYTLFFLLAEYDSVSYNEAAQEDKWRKAMDDEIESIRRNDTWELTTLPEGHKPIEIKWAYKTKTNQDGKVEKYKARLVAKDYSQQEGIDYE